MAKKKEPGHTTKNGTNLEKGPAKQPPSAVKAEAISIIMLMLAVFVMLILLNYHSLQDQTQFIGVVGTYLGSILVYGFGSVALLIPIFVVIWAIHLSLYRRWWSTRMWGVAILALSIIIYFGIYRIPLGLNPWEAAQKGLGSGYLGGGIAYIISSLLGRVGASVLLILSVVLSIILVMQMPLSEIAGWILIKARNYGQKLNSILYYEVETEDVAQPAPASQAVIINQDNDHIVIDRSSADKKSEPVVKEIPAEKPKIDHHLELVYNAKSEYNQYVRPSLEMLSMVESDRTIDKKNIRDSITILEDTFTSFGVSVKVNQVSCGPAVTRYELTPAPGVKVSKILSLTDDLQLNLAAPGIRIEAPIPGKPAIGIEVPRTKVGSVGLRNILSSTSFKKLNSPLAFALGEDISGKPVVAKLSDMPHLLIAGSTGSGKSVCLNSIIMSLLYNTRPDELKLVFIDPKMVELTVYNGIPHLMTPVVTDPKKASVVLRWMTTEMEKRYKLFADKGVRDIYRYNQTCPPLPFIVIVIDELADLMMVAPVEVEDSICRLAQMARAAGIHLLVATQRPSVDVVTGIIKANIPSRIAFAVSSQTDSRTILDIGGAEKLLGKGDMLFSPVGAVKPFRVQGAFVSDRDIETTVNFIKHQTSAAVTEDQFKDIESHLDSMDLDYGDELLWDAVRVIVENQKASVSFLQRKLKVGYSRAARLMDIMEERGIVSAADASKKREILIDEEQMEKLYANNKLC